VTVPSATARAEEPDEMAKWLLPAEAYWSPSWYRREQERLFARVWNFVGTLDDLTGGTTLVATVAGCPFSIFLDRNGTPASLDGSVDSWAGLLFAHLDPAAGSLASWLRDVPDRIGGYRPDRLVEVARHRFKLAANWKLFVENHVDVYHLWYLHAESLGDYDHTRAEWHNTGPHWVFYEPPRDTVDTGADLFWRGLPPVGHVGADRWGSGAHLIFPNLTFASGAGFFMTYECVPLAADRSVVDMRVRTEPGSDPSAMLAMSRQIIEREDGGACAAMQAAVRSPAFSVGPLARRHELPISRFQRSVLQWMGAS
jgi:Rieske 2Fe-2S family protein